MSSLVAVYQGFECPPIAGKPTEFSTRRGGRAARSATCPAPGALRPERSVKHSLHLDRGDRDPRAGHRNSSDMWVFRLRRFQAGVPRNFVPETSGVSDRRCDLIPVIAWGARRQFQIRPTCICRRQMGAKDRRPEMASGMRTTPLRPRQIPTTSSDKNDRRLSLSEEFAGRARHLSLSRSKSCRGVRPDETSAAQPAVRSHIQLLLRCNGQESIRAESRRENTRRETQKSIRERKE